MADDSVISSGTPSFGGNSHRHSAPMAEKPNPDKPLMIADRPRMQTRTNRVVTENSLDTTANRFKINVLAGAASCTRVARSLSDPGCVG